jgi:hypothetical protein
MAHPYLSLSALVFVALAPAPAAAQSQGGTTRDTTTDIAAVVIAALIIFMVITVIIFIHNLLWLASEDYRRFSAKWVCEPCLRCCWYTCCCFMPPFGCFFLCCFKRPKNIYRFHSEPQQQRYSINPVINPVGRTQSSTPSGRASQWVAGAARGEAEALCQLGACYYQGDGVPQSYERAAELFEQAAAQGDTKAQTNLGYLYYYGRGVPKDVARGVALLKQAAAGRNKATADILRVLGEAVPPGAP